MAQGVKLFSTVFPGTNQLERALEFSRRLRPENGNQPRIYPRDVNQDEFTEILSFETDGGHGHGRLPDKTNEAKQQTYLIQ